MVTENYFIDIWTKSIQFDIGKQYLKQETVSLRSFCVYRMRRFKNFTFFKLWNVLFVQWARRDLQHFWCFRTLFELFVFPCSKHVWPKLIVIKWYDKCQDLRGFALDFTCYHRSYIAKISMASMYMYTENELKPFFVSRRTILRNNRGGYPC